MASFAPYWANLFGARSSCSSRAQGLNTQDDHEGRRGPFVVSLILIAPLEATRSVGQFRGLTIVLPITLVQVFIPLPDRASRRSIHAINPDRLCPWPGTVTLPL